MCQWEKHPETAEITDVGSVYQGDVRDSKAGTVTDFLVYIISVIRLILLSEPRPFLLRGAPEAFANAAWPQAKKHTRRGCAFQTQLNRKSNYLAAGVATTSTFSSNCSFL